MFDTTAKQILNYYKKEFDITNKNMYNGRYAKTN